jgi:hypothetical protein
MWMAIQNRIQTGVNLKKSSGRVAKTAACAGWRKLEIIFSSTVILIKSFGSALKRLLG